MREVQYTLLQSRLRNKEQGQARVALDQERVKYKVNVSALQDCVL